MKDANGTVDPITLTVIWNGLMSIAEELGRTWQISYYTAARPGDRIRLDVTVPGQGEDEAALTIPRSQAAPVEPSASKLLRSWITQVAPTHRQASME